MIKTEFGIIEHFDAKQDYTPYTPEKYRCVAIDDDLYLNDWWEALGRIHTFNVYAPRILQPQKALSRWGITILPPDALPGLLEIVCTDKRYPQDKRLVALAMQIRRAIERGKYMIHYGV